MAKTSKHARKGKHGRSPPRRNGLRNADAPAAAARRQPSTRASSEPGSHHGRADTDTPGWKAIKTAGGALGAALACAYIARENWLPPSAVTGVVSAIGATLAVGGSKEIYRDLGLGVMSAAGSQLALLTIDTHLASSGGTAPTVASAAGSPKKPANADTLPPGALEDAYRRARQRLAMANAVGQPA
jgi:hypothetical protein